MESSNPTLSAQHTSSATCVLAYLDERNLAVIPCRRNPLFLMAGANRSHAGLGASTDIIVVVIRAIARMRVESKTVPSQTVSVRPDWSTWPTATSRSVFAGLRKWILNSTVSTSCSAGIIDSAA